MRLAIAVALAREPVPQLLLLDEPSNDLDLRSLRELAQTLRRYAGALLVVSHDEAFLRDAAIEERLELPPTSGEDS
jgi:ATPase subunit of ABC transporter with duplicated ATPase domains